MVATVAMSILLVTTFREGVGELEIAAVSRLVSVGILVVALGIGALAGGPPQQSTLV